LKTNVFNDTHMNMWHEIAYGDDAPNIINTIIEIPRGTKNKYEIDKATGLIKLDRAMHTAQDYPLDYGFVPQTLWDDGDALDVAVLTTYPLATGVMVEARVVGVMRMIDSGECDDKVIAVPSDDPRWDAVTDISDVNPHTLKEMKHFFETYKSIDDKIVEVTGFDDVHAAREAVQKGIRMYAEKYPKKTA